MTVLRKTSDIIDDLLTVSNDDTIKLVPVVAGQRVPEKGYAVLFSLEIVYECDRNSVVDYVKKHKIYVSYNINDYFSIDNFGDVCYLNVARVFPELAVSRSFARDNLSPILDLKSKRIFLSSQSFEWK